MVAKVGRRGIPAAVALPILITGAAACVLRAVVLVLENIMKYLNCTVGSGDPYCFDGTWSAGHGFKQATVLAAAGAVMIVLARTFKNPKHQAAQRSTLPPPPAPPPPPTAILAEIPTFHWTCPNCKGSSLDGAKSCSSCGVSFRETGDVQGESH